MNKFLQYRAFASVIEEGNLSAAARALNVTPAAIAKQLNLLEASLAVRLVDRTHQGINATDAGKRFYRRAKEILHAVEDIETDILEQESTVAGPLAITLSNSILRSRVSQWLFEFSHRYPDVQLTLRTSERVLDLYADDIDFALRLGDLGDSSRLYRNKLCSVRLCCVATPGYLQEHGKPSTFKDLVNHRLIVPDSQNLSEQLRRTMKRYQSVFNKPMTQSTNDIEVVYQSVANGSCIGFLLDVSIEKELDSNAFIDLFPNQGLPVKHLYLVRKRNQQTSERLNRFRQFMIDQARE